MAGIEELIDSTYKGLVPMELRTYLKAISEQNDPVRAPITEKQYSPEELYAMHDIMSREYNRVKELGGPMPKQFSISEYEKYDDKNPNRPYEGGVSNTLGRFAFTGDPEKGFDVRDNYDFIDEKSAPIYDKYKGEYTPGLVYESIKKQYVDNHPDYNALEKIAPFLSVQPHLEAYGLAALGKQGVPVNIHTTPRPKSSIQDLLSNY